MQELPTSGAPNVAQQSGLSRDARAIMLYEALKNRPVAISFGSSWGCSAATIFISSVPALRSRSSS